MRIRRMSSPGRVLVAVLALLTPAALYAVAASADAGVVVVPATNWTVRVANQANHGAIQGLQFLPGDITINQGDSVTWRARAGEPHTVTFVDGGTPQTPEQLGEFNPGDPSQTTRSSNHDFDGLSTYESGVMTTRDSYSALPPFVQLYHRYTLHFLTTPVGTYTYYCRVHGVMMRGEIHVQAAGSARPATQADYDAQATFLAHAIVADGRAELKKAQALSGSHKVIVGADDGMAMVMRFVRGKVVVHKGDTVTWANKLNGVPHTVTFGGPPAGDPTVPYGHPGSFRGGKLSSGVISPQGTFKVTFKKTGTFAYHCFFHVDLGMKGVVVVKP
jgi:plastocyanin